MRGAFKIMKGLSKRIINGKTYYYRKKDYKNYAWQRDNEELRVQDRECLKCSKKFKSTHKHNRICKECKIKNESCWTVDGF